MTGDIHWYRMDLAPKMEQVHQGPGHSTINGMVSKGSQPHASAHNHEKSEGGRDQWQP